MTVYEITQRLELKTLVEGDKSKKVKGGYTGDLLSWVMGRAQENDAWITVIGNINAIAVAVLADTSCIILAENSPLDEDARRRAVSENVTVLGSKKTSYRLSAELYLLLNL